MIRAIWQGLHYLVSLDIAARALSSADRLPPSPFPVVDLAVAQFATLTPTPTWGEKAILIHPSKCPSRSANSGYPHSP
jgi:hypothetical protein